MNRISIAACALLFGACTGGADTDEKRGVFFDSPVTGLQYMAAPSGIAGATDAEGGFRFVDGDTLTFSIGDVALGSAPASEWITPLDLVPDASDDVRHPRLNNIGMLIQSLDRNGNNEDGIDIPAQAHDVVRELAPDLDLPSDEFYVLMQDSVVAGIAALGAFDPVPGGAMKNSDDAGTNFARTPEMARNQLRRTQAGIMRITDVKIPLRGFDPDTNPDEYLLGTLHRPVGPGAPVRAPVVVNLGIYGKDRIFGSICTREELQEQAVIEDRYRSGNPDHLPYENHESVDTFQWVPAGYAVLRVDEAGIGRSPGRVAPLSEKTALDYVDVIDWAGAQAWSNGNVGANGISYYAMTQWLMAPHLQEGTALRAMIPWEGAVDAYRDFFYPGGLLIDGFTRMWGALAGRNNCNPTPRTDVSEAWTTQSFNEPDVWDEFSADLAKVRVPFMSAAGVDNMSLHPRGNVMAFRLAPAEHKLLRIQTGSHIGPFYSPDGVADQMAFFDYWLKGIDNGIMDKPPVKIAVKTGDDRGAYWTYSETWPPADTAYTKFYLDAQSLDDAFEVDGSMPAYRLVPSSDVVTETANPVESAPQEAASATYSAAVQPIVQNVFPPPPRFERQQACDSYGISFVTPPLTDALILAGNAKLVTWVSSSSDDMDLHVSLRVYDENGEQLVYSTDEHRLDADQKPPLQQGRLKVSQRKLDAQRSTFFQPVHTHREADSRKLGSGEIVPVEVEFWPISAEIKQGHRIVVDVQPYHGCGHAWPHEFGDYNTGTNTLFTGPQHISYVQLPIVSGLIEDQDAAWSVN